LEINPGNILSGGPQAGSHDFDGDHGLSAADTEFDFHPGCPAPGKKARRRNQRWREKSLQIYLPQWVYNRYVWILMGVFILGMDFWAWNKIGMLFWGIPLWVGYFVVLSTLQTIAMVYLVRKDD
jgi:hypothetical protein